jgi:Transmembrane domain of unknown function (DUF3566)
MVTSRATGDDLIEDQEPPPADITAAEITSDIMAPPRQPARRPAKPAKDAPAAKEAARPAPVDATVIDGIPALPADSIGSSRGTKPEEAPKSTGSTGSGAAAKPSGDAPVTTASSPASSGTASSGTGSSAAAAEPSSVPPAAFAWEMPDPPPNSPSSPARAFLRSGVTAKNPAPAKTGSAAPAAKAATAKPAPGEAPAHDPALGGPAQTGPLTIGQPRSAAKTGTAQKARQKGQSKRGARQAHLTVSRVEPWSVMKFSFVVSLVAFVILFVAVSVLYGALSGLGVFDSLQRVVSSLTSSQGSTGVNAKAWFSASRVLGYTALLGSLNIVLITAMSTIGSVVYNLTSRLVGGVEVTLRETE